MKTTFETDGNTVIIKREAAIVELYEADLLFCLDYLKIAKETNIKTKNYPKTEGK